MMNKSALKEFFPTFKKTLKGEMFFKIGENKVNENKFLIKKVKVKRIG